MAGQGGGSWKVAYADFVTAMMAFFMVMWLTSQNEAIKEAVAHHFEDPFSPYEPIESANANKPKPGPTTNVPLPKQPDDNKKKARRTRKPTLITMGDGNQTTTGTVVFFPPQSAELDLAAQTELRNLLPSILGKPQKIEIRGHASRRPLPADSKYQDAWQLSYVRTLATMQFLEQHGIGAERMRLSQAGVYEPSSSNVGLGKLDSQERVEVTLLNELARDSLTGANGTSPAPAPEPSSGKDSQTEANGPPTHSTHSIQAHGLQSHVSRDRPPARNSLGR